VPGPTAQTLARLAPTRTFISGRAEPGSRRTPPCQHELRHFTAFNH
jgi:hypothetical protein